MALPTRLKYQGDSRRLLLAFDIGTTFSGISYSILDPGKMPEIKAVTQFPDQERIGGDSKIPTVIYYDSSGKPCAIGAETLKDGIETDAEDNQWTKAYWFKLHLRPKPNRRDVGEDDEYKIPPLPPNKTVVEVFTDYMQYLLRCAKSYIAERHGSKLWDSLEGDIIYVLTHPNGWGGLQQGQMREAAILAGFIPNTFEGRSRINFVTEGEASLHFCLSNGLEISEGNDEGAGVLIVDAGGGTIDVTAYRKLSDGSFEEIAIPTCHFQGAAFVTMRAHGHFSNLLSGTRFQHDVPTLTTRFDRNTKHVFRKEDEPLHIQFASHRERDQNLHIRGGRITLEGSTVAKFFEPSVNCIIDAIKTQKSIAHFPIKSAFLVGGFSASNWLYEQVRADISKINIAVSRPDSHVNKAVSNGAVSFYLDGFVKARVSQLTYGVRCNVHYMSSDPEHQKRSTLVYVDKDDGCQMLEGAFAPILPKNTRVQETKEFRQAFGRTSSSPEQLNHVATFVRSYHENSSVPLWIVDEPDKYPVLCMISADTSLVKKERLYSAKTAGYYYQTQFDVVLLFGLTELKAQIAYVIDGVEKRGPAQVVFQA